MTNIAEARKIIQCTYDDCESTISKITDYIYLTGLPGSLDYEKLKSLGIQHIILMIRYVVYLKIKIIRYTTYRIIRMWSNSQKSQMSNYSFIYRY